MSFQNSFRGDFPFFQHRKDLVYLDSAASAQKPSPVIDAISRFYEREYATVHRGVYDLSREATRSFNESREAIRQFLGAGESEIIFTRSATASINLVARSLQRSFFKKGDQILVSEIEHHSNLLPWQMIGTESGLKLSFLPVNDAGELILEEVERKLKEGVKLVSIAHMSNSLGVIHPIEKIIKLARREGALVLLDAAQSASHLPLNVKNLDVDFLVFSGHKIYGPTGIGVLYGKREHLEKMPPIEGGGDMVDYVSLERSTYASLPQKFEAGTPMIAEAIGLKAAIDYLSKIGFSKIRELEKPLHSYLEKRLSEIEGIKIFGNSKEKGPITSFIVEGLHPLDLGLFLEAKGICLRTGHHCSQPTMQRLGISGTLRASLGLYNTYEDIDRFIAALKSTIERIKDKG